LQWLPMRISRFDMKNSKMKFRDERDEIKG